MRATEYGLLHYGNYSFTDIKSNIYAFNNEINIVNDETNENESNAYTEIIYVEIEPTDGNPNEFKLAEDGEILDYREGNYILNSNVIPAMEVSDSSTVFLQNLSIQARICKFGEKYFALVTKNIAGAVAWETFLGGLEIVATQMKKKKREKITLLNDILREKQLSVVLFISKDGALLETAYQSIDNLYENEIVLFIETNDSMNLFGSVIRIKTGANVSSSSGVPYKKLSKIVDYFNTNVSSSALQEIIKQHIADKSSGFFIVKRAFWGAVNRVVRFSSDLTLEGIGKISNGIGGLVGKLKLDDSKWQYYDDNGQPLKNASLFLPALGVIKYLQEANKKSKPEETNANAINKIIELEDILKESKKTLGKADFFKKIINQLLYMLRKVKDFLRDPLGKALDFTETAFVIYNAFVVGIINSIVDAIKGIFDIISILCNALAALQKKGRDIGQNPLSYLRLFFEIIENMVETLENLFSKENLKALIEFFKKSAAFILTLPTRAFAWLAENAAMPNLDKVAYYIGYIIGFIIQLILEILFTGGAKTAADAFKKLADSLINIFKTMKKIAFKFSDEVVIGFENLLAIFAYIREKSKNLGVLLDEVLEIIQSSFRNKKVDDISYLTKNVGSGGYLKYLKVISNNMFAQEHSMSCAPACIRQLAKDYGINLTEKSIRDIANTTEKFGTFIDDIGPTLEKVFINNEIHFGHAHMPQLSSKEIVEILSKNNSWIAVVKPTNGIEHTIIIDKIVGKKVFIRDPWPINGISKTASGVEAVIDINDFIISWERAGQYFARIK